MKEKTYVTHTCKNSRLKESDKDYCFNAFIDIDRHNTTAKAPSWRYCEKCVEAGFKNPATRTLNLTEEQIAIRKERLRIGREIRLNNIQHKNKD